MKLVDRVSVFFLTALAVVLIVTSGSFYAFIRAHLVQQFDRELLGAFYLLVAAVEVEPQDVSWQPLEHTIELGTVQGPEAVLWAVIGDSNHIVETSPNATADFIKLAQSLASRSKASPADAQIFALDQWRILHQKLVATAPDDSQRDLDEFDMIDVVVVRSSVSLNTNLRRLLILVAALPVVIWILAAATGHWFCRRALQPVWEMTDQARSMSDADFHSRLSVTDSGDELADLAEAFNTLLDSQNRSFEQQRRFAGDAAHELRTPITVLLGQIDVALRRSRSPEEHAAILRILREETTQLQTIVESLLFLARSEEDAVLPDLETFELEAWLTEYMARWEANPRHCDIDLQKHSVGAIQVRASKTLLARLLDNLLENALKYSEPGSRVELTTTSHVEQVLIEVRDHGRGIAPEDQSDIFKPFFRTKSARHAGISGTGLGLAIAARIAMAFHGQLKCSSPPGGGSRFTLQLPIVSGVSGQV